MSRTLTGNPTTATLAAADALDAARRRDGTEAGGCALSSARSYPGRLPATTAARRTPSRTSAALETSSTTWWFVSHSPLPM